MRRLFDSSLVAALFCSLAIVQVGVAQIPQQPPLPGNQNLPNPNQNGPNIFSGTGSNLYYGENLVPFGPEQGDKQILANMQAPGQTIDLHTYFPFYGGLYNYTTISIHGYVGFATVLDSGMTINVGPLNTDWPRQQDPAMIAPYLCKQQTAKGNAGARSGVYYRVVMRQSMFGQANDNNLNYGNMGQSSYVPGGQQAPPACRGAGAAGGYVQCNAQSDYFLDEMMRWLQEGVAGASAFRADAALVVTWYNTASAIVGTTDMGNEKLATYQLVWLTDRQQTLSYAIINYDKLGFEAADYGTNSRNGRCQALFNGGNHTGVVPIDPTDQFKISPKILARRSGVPHVVRGRYMFRVDDLVRPAGCSNKTGGTFPLMIYPNIINMLGEMTVEVNGLCMDAATTYVLMIEQRPTGPCTQINPAIARCTLPKVWDWGTKTVYFQPQSGGANDEKAYVGYIYFVPPTIDPMRLDIGNIYEWFKNPMTSRLMPVSWYPRNFTNPDLEREQGRRTYDDSIYNVQLGLYVIGYKEFQDDTIKKFRPEHKPIALLGTIANSIEYRYRWQPQQWMVNLDQVERWLISDWDRNNDLYTYRLGYLKLAPMRPNDPNGDSSLITGLVSAPISLHWLWTNNNAGYSASSAQTMQEMERRAAFVQEKAKEMCHDWYNEDGAQWNFIHDTETNASCPCVEDQARMDLGRFMPHPRCSQTFRDVTCTSTIGARNCYMSAQNIYGSYSGTGNNNYADASSRFATHYGQVCCYDDRGTLMQTSYQPVIKVTDETPYSPGFPMRAYEFGTEPYQGQYQIPGLSGFYHDQMPYFLCCKYAKFRCQLFYWRRPSSGCQAYQPPAIGFAMGAGTFNTIDNQKFIFNEPGVYTLLYIPQTATNPMVRIQIRLERYPNRKVDFSLLGLRLQQEDLVQPTNATVITAVAIETGDSDRVHVLARKDTRRMRYRTSIIVGNILRYFDTMKLQRYRGVMIYVNNVQRGQSEIYVVLEKAQIGLRIRESYAMDIDRLSSYQESMGMLDIELSVPPQYGVRPDGTLPRENDYRNRFDLPRVMGLMRPFPDAGVNSYQNSLNMNNDVNNDGIRQQLINQYRVTGTGEQGSAQSNFGAPVNRDIPQDNMFVTSRDEDKKFDAFPDAALKSSPIYQTAPQYQTGYNRFSVKTGQAVMQFLENCRTYETSETINMQPQQSDIYNQLAIQCPENAGEILQMCGDNAPCLYDATMLQSKVLGTEAQDNWNAFNAQRFEAVKQYNSCGAINIEYPEYLLKTPVLSSGYLQNDVVRFECFQSHWVKGDTEYKCSIVQAGNDPYNYRFEWNKGWQPWCRSRELDNFFQWMTAIFSILAIIMVVVLIFLCCWCSKRARVEKNESRRNSVSGRQPYYRRGEYIPASQKVPLPVEKNEVPVFENTPKAQMYSGDNGHTPNRINSVPLHTDRPDWRNDYPNRPPSGYSTPPRYNTPPHENGNAALQGFNTRV